MSEKIRVLLIKQNMSITELAKRLEVTPQNMYNKLKRDNFSVKEMQEIANVVGVNFECNFLLDDGTKI